MKTSQHTQTAEKFVHGKARYDEVLRALQRDGGEVDVTIPDVGPRPFRYSESDRQKTPRFWMAKLQREANAFAHEVVRQAASFPQMVISSPRSASGLRAAGRVGDFPRHRRAKRTATDP